MVSKAMCIALSVGITTAQNALKHAIVIIRGQYKKGPGDWGPGPEDRGPGTGDPGTRTHLKLVAHSPAPHTTIIRLAFQGVL